MKCSSGFNLEYDMLCAFKSTQNDSNAYTCPERTVSAILDQTSNVYCVESVDTKKISPISERKEFYFSTENDKKILLVNFEELSVKSSIFKLGNYYLYKEIKIDEISKPLKLFAPYTIEFLIKKDTPEMKYSEQYQFTGNVFSTDKLITYDGDVYKLNTSETKQVTLIKSLYMFIGIGVFVFIILLLVLKRKGSNNQ